MTPMPNLGGGRQNHTFLDDVRVPEEYMIGQAGGGWQMIMNAFYGGGIHAGHAYFERAFGEVLRHCKQTLRGGQPMIDDPLVRQQVGRLALMVEQIKLLTYESVSNYNNQKPPQFGGALGVVVSKETRPLFFELCNQIVGPLCQLQGGRFAPLGGQAEAWYRHSYANHAGGTSQVKRMVLATRGLGLPR
jgi:alkylation response protein AidB-like acyl-CoA dehydrogenase